MTVGEMTWTKDEVPLLTDEDAPQRRGVRVGFSKRAGGISAAPYDSLNMSPFIGDDPRSVARNHDLFSGAFSAPVLKFVKQVHGDVVQDAGVVPRPADGPCILGEGDASVAGSDETGALVVLTADCVPILLAGEERIAAVHAGWRGLIGGVIERAAERVGGPQGAWVGPSIRGCCYEVGEEVLGAFSSHDLPLGEGSHVDPGRAALVILRRLGVEDIRVSTDCTSCDRSFFSYRRDGVTGRQAAAIAWA